MNDETNRLGNYEHKKLARASKNFYKSIEKMKSMDYTIEDFIHHFPAFTGDLTLARFITLYEIYKMTLGVSGHIAEVGVYKGASSIFFAKLIKLYEPYALTLAHGFDWFKGAKITDEEKYVENGACKESYERLIELIKIQELDDILHIHNIDVATDLDGFFKKNNHLQFKLVFLDCGIYDVVKESIKHFWSRLTVGGIMVFDQFNHEFAPGETRAIKELLPNEKIQTFPNGWMPTAYVVKQ